MADAPKYPTALGVSTRESISLLGEDLAEDLIGRVDFGELAFRLLTLRSPSPSEAAMFNAALVSLADHGFTPVAIAARLTYFGAPESIQGALAAGLLGGGSRFLGVSENTGRFLGETLDKVVEAQTPLPTDDAGWDRLALEAITRLHEAGEIVPGLGHHLHKEGDPRVPRLFALAEQHGTFGPHLSLYRAMGRVAPQATGRNLPLNGAGACGAVLADLGIPREMLRGVVLLARCAGLLGHLAEERRSPIASQVFSHVEESAYYVAPDQGASSNGDGIELGR